MDKLKFDKDTFEAQYLAHKDEVLGKLMDVIGEISIDLDNNYFSTLVRTIIGQMLSAKSAATICGRTEELCREFSPEKILSIKDGEFRNCGISGAKVSYIKDLAEKVLSKRIDLSNLESLEDNEVLKAVTNIKGIGKWTAEMFLIFSLGRVNVLSLGDAGLQRAVKWLYNMKDRKGNKYLESFDGKWEPYNSIASLYLWEAINRGFVDNYPSFNVLLLENDTGVKPSWECWPSLPAGSCVDHGDYIDIIPPEEFSFEQCLVFLNRSEKESTHSVQGKYLYKLFKIDENKILTRLSIHGGNLKVEFSNIEPEKTAKMEVVKYIRRWFDLDTDLKEFYETARKDKLLNPLIEKYYGLRLLGINDLFEALAWAVIGQQINLNFAYTLKKRMVEAYGESFEYNEQSYWLFPSAETISKLNTEDLTKMQFTQKKAEYLIGIAKLISSGELSEEKLRLIESYEEILKVLTDIRGIGRWSADYAIMKCLRIYSAFPVDDVGLKNAVKAALKLNEKPSNEYLRKLGKKWAGFEGYATFYLWQSLGDL